VAFDGAHIWVTNFGSANVTELSASSGATLGTYAVGTHPNGIAFDGSHIWLTNSGSANVSKL
jgi:DNA-binding beta-propeller fold protein YncE